MGKLFCSDAQFLKAAAAGVPVLLTNGLLAWGYAVSLAMRGIATSAIVGRSRVRRIGI